MSKHQFKYILGVPFSNCNFSEILKGFQECIKNRSKNHVSITNTETLYHALRMPDLYCYINQAVFSCCDGVAITFIAKLKGIGIPRLHGPDLMSHACRFGIEKKWRHFFYGGKKGVPERLSRNLKQKYPGISIVGTYSPPFRQVGAIETPSFIERINDAQPDIIWVGLGLLKQMRWIADHRDMLNASLMVGVGAAFDFHAGTVRRAPEVYRRTGMEWLYRLFFEPRMLKRNWMSLMIALELLLRPAIMRRTPVRLRRL